MIFIDLRDEFGITQAVVNDEDPFKAFGDDLEISDEDLPF
jgi:aspartyl-tRNA synthetase